VQFLNPWTALAAASIAVPLLLTLYMLRLRRRVQRMSSTLLWRQAYADIQANVPFQRLHASWLLLLQFVALLLLLLVVAEPFGTSRRPIAARTILIIDHSASMSASLNPRSPDDPSTRLDAAIAAASRIIDERLRTGNDRQLMIIACAGRAEIISSYSANRAQLKRLLRTINVYDEPADLDAALDLADVFATSTAEGSRTLPDVVIMTDGGVLPSKRDEYRVQANAVSVPAFLDDGEDLPTRNIGIVDLSARRNPVDPARIRLLARMAGTLDVEETVRVTTYLGDEAVSARTVTIPPVTPDDHDAALGMTTFTTEVSAESTAVIRVELAVEDALPADDIAAIVVPPRAEPRVLLIHPDDGPDRFLLQLLELAHAGRVQRMQASRFESLADQPASSLPRVDVLVFDRVSTDQAPLRPSLFFGGAPGMVEVDPPAHTGGQRFLSWDRQHPVMRHVALDAVVFADFGTFRDRANGTVLARGTQGAAIITIREQGIPHVVVGPALEHTNWPLDVSFAVFLQNAIDYLLAARLGAGSDGVVRPLPGGAWGQYGIAYTAGAPITVPVAPDATTVLVQGDRAMQYPVRQAGDVTIAPLRRVGLYHVVGVDAPWNRIAVNLTSARETDLRIGPDLVVDSQPPTEVSAADRRSRSLAPWMLLIVAIILVAEWAVYVRRIRV
jgi:hypothetical protein